LYRGAPEHFEATQRLLGPGQLSPCCRSRNAIVFDLAIEAKWGNQGAAPPTNLRNRSHVALKAQERKFSKASGKFAEIHLCFSIWEC
jgi:hypothetical protein